MAGKTRPRKNFPAWSQQTRIYYIFHVCCKSLILSPLKSLLCFKCLRPKKATQQNKILQKFAELKNKMPHEENVATWAPNFLHSQYFNVMQPFLSLAENSANVLSSEINDILDMFSELLFWYKYVIRCYSVVIKNWIAIKYWQFQYLKSK